MKYNELFTTETGGIFANIFAPNYASLYATIFGEMDAAKVDVWTRKTFGGKTLLLDAQTIAACNDIIAAAIELNSDRWEKQAQALNASYDLLAPVTTKTERTDTNDISDQTNRNTETSKKAYNESDYTGDEQTTDTETGTRSETGTGTTTTTGTGGNTAPVLIQQEMELRKTAFRQDIIKQLVDEITTGIFE